MGWASGGEIFNIVADALIEAEADTKAIAATCSRLIAELESGDWDTQDESVERYVRLETSEQANAVLQALAEAGHQAAWCDAAKQSTDYHGTRLRHMCSMYEGHPGPHASRVDAWEASAAMWDGVK